MNIQNVLSLVLIVVSVSSVMLISSQMARADDLKYQELSRAMPPKRKAYPVLESLERQLYPGQDFHDENPSHRLERLEIAIFGAIQSGTIVDRLEKLGAELSNWQIASSPKPNQRHQLKANTNDDAQHYALEAQARAQAASERMRYSKFLMDERSKARYETNLVRVANPIVQKFSKQTIEAMFGNKQKG